MLASFRQSDLQPASLADALDILTRWSSVSPPPWAQIAAVLAHVRQSNLLEHDPQSFGHWVGTVEKSTGITGQQLQKYLAAGDAWERLREKAGPRDYPVLAKLSAKFAPEMVMLLTQVADKAPIGDLRQAMRDALAGKISRAGLRRIIQNGGVPRKPAAASRAASAPPPEPSEETAAPATGQPAEPPVDWAAEWPDIFLALAIEFEDLAGGEEGRIYQHVDLGADLRVDAVVVQPDADGQAQLHGFFVPDTVGDLEADRLRALMPFFDHVWVILSPALITQAVGLPRQTGVLVWREGALGRIRSAGDNASKLPDAADMVMDALAHADASSAL